MPLPQPSTVLVQSSGSDGSVTFVVATLLFGVGAAYFLYRMAASDGHHRRLAAVHACVAAVAAAAYAAMFLGVGIGTVSLPVVGSAEVNWMRYLDWAITTPLLLYAVLQFTDSSSRAVGAVVALDLGMIAVGFVATVSIAGGMLDAVMWNFAVTLLAMVAWVAVLYVLFIGVEQHAVDEDFGVLRNALVGLWSLYPFVWMAAITGTLPLATTDLGFLLLDLLTKVVFGLLVLRYGAEVSFARIHGAAADLSA